MYGHSSRIRQTLWLSGWLFLAGCGTSDGDKEAQRIFEEHYAHSFARCGESLYFEYRWQNDGSHGYDTRVLQIRNAAVTTTVSPRPLNDADRASGLRWHGSISMEAPSGQHRTACVEGFYCSAKPEWSEWGQGSVSLAGLTLVNVNGDWATTEARRIALPTTPLTCDQLQKLGLL
jgi:hypothetical protein